MNQKAMKRFRTNAKRMAAKRNAKLKPDQPRIVAEDLAQKMKKDYLKKKRKTNEPNLPKLSRRQKIKWEHDHAMSKMRMEEAKNKPTRGLANLRKPRTVTL